MSQKYDVIIVGGGIVGCMAARELAPDHDVLVVERDQIGGGATGKASGLVTVVEEYSDTPAAAAHAIEFFREYDGTGHFSFHERSYVELRSDEHDVASLRDHAATLRENGFDAAFHTPDELENRFPDTFELDGHAGGIVYEDAGWLDPYTFVTTVKEDAERDGATFLTGVEVDDLAVEDGSIVGVDTEADERIRAEQVVVAAGWRTRQFVSEHVSIPTRPYRYQTYNLDHERTLTEEFPMAWDEHSHLYFRAEPNGELHIGGGTYFVKPPGTPRSTTTEGFQRLIAGTIPELITNLGEAQFVAGDTCRFGDSATPDRYPIIDAPAEAPEGLAVATGTHGFGIMAAPVIGTAIRMVVTDEDGPFSVDEFSLDRFEDRSTDFGSSYIAESPELVGPQS
ncbi:NAD(P)/FAD-dependent oxidoreductase [Natribaculum luteum]|uniref:NAD(P)/FAD-dependent oxidoreductase n=1 Tax=Natribaculum luteum TaxID=1586232 RepID=A0ABD5P3C1_9EURY|nr:FAD-dependent oxidoreductase [Natribaculum luteum]